LDHTFVVATKVLLVNNTQKHLENQTINKRKSTNPKGKGKNFVKRSPPPKLRQHPNRKQKGENSTHPITNPKHRF